MPAPRLAAPALAAPRTRLVRGGLDPEPDAGARPLGLWPGYGPAQTPRGFVPLQIEGAAPAVMTPYGPGIRIERGTTNFVTNPSFEVDLTGWSAVAGATISRETALDAAFGDAYALVEVAANGDGIRFAGAGNAEQGESYAASMYLRAATPSDLGKEVQVYVDAPGGTYEIFAVSHTLTDTWTRVTLPVTWAEAGHTGWGVAVRSAVPQGPFDLALDGAQYEVGAATTWASGEGDGSFWTGTPHSSESVRQPTLASAFRLERQEGTLFAALAPDWGATDAREHVVLDWVGSSGERLVLRGSAVGEWEWRQSKASALAAVSVAQAHLPGELVVLFAKWSPGSIGIGNGGGTLASTNALSGSIPSASQAALGRAGAGGLWLDAVITGLGMLPRRISTAERQALLSRLARSDRWGV